MDFLELAKKRYSVRKYQNKAIEEDKLNYVLECGRVAPSAVNNQPWHFIVVTEKEKKQKIMSTYKKPWILSAPALIVVCGDHQKSWRRPDGKDHCDIDIAIAIDHMTLAASEKGLGTCWVCMFDAFNCHTLLKLPSHLEVIALLPIGCPDREKNLDRHITRKGIDQIVHWNGYTEKIEHKCT